MRGYLLHACRHIFRDRWYCRLVESTGREHDGTTMPLTTVGDYAIAIPPARHAEDLRSGLYRRANPFGVV